MRITVIIFIMLLLACGQKRDVNNLGLVKYLPKGEYIIWNHGSRHIVKCLKPNGEYYLLNDANFDVNGIEGRDAHQYHEQTRVIIR